MLLVITIEKKFFYTNIYLKYCLFIELFKLDCQITDTTVLKRGQNAKISSQCISQGSYFKTKKLIDLFRFWA